MAFQISRETHHIDATGKRPGRLASQIAMLLIGKNKPSYTPNVDNGDKVEVTNVKGLVFSGNKAEGKVYQRHTGFLGHLKEKQAKTLQREKPAEVLRHAVSRMLPKNKLRTNRLKRLTFKG